MKITLSATKISPKILHGKQATTLQETKVKQMGGGKEIGHARNEILTKSEKILKENLAFDDM